MPARLVLPSSTSLQPSPSIDDGRPLDLEAEFCKAAKLVVGDDGLDRDTLEALACLACEALGDGGVGAADAILEAIRPVLAESSLEQNLQEQVGVAMVKAARLETDSQQGVPVAEVGASAIGGVLPSSMSSKPLLAPLRKRQRKDAPPKPLLTTDRKDADDTPATELVTPDAEESAEAVSTTEIGPKTWKKRGDAEAERALSYLRERGAKVAADRVEAAEHHQKLGEYFSAKIPEDPAELAAEIAAEGQKAKEGSDSSSDSDSDKEEDPIAKADRDKCKRRLRELGEVATFFGENDKLRADRLKHLELNRDQNELASGSVNVMQLLERKSRGMVNAERDEEDYAGLMRSNQMNSSRRVAAIADMSEAMGADGDFPWKDDEKEDKALDDAEEEEDEEIKGVITWVRNTLRHWETSLHEKMKTLGNNSRDLQADKGHFRQSKQYLRPLRKKLKDGEIPRDIVRSIAFIALKAEARDYKAAKEGYMRMAIGNSAWPMGVNMVTFHDRPGRHNISEESANAHILNDETTRKYVQMIKRLVTFCEMRFPTDPSRAA